MLEKIKSMFTRYKVLDIFVTLFLLIGIALFSGYTLYGNPTYRTLCNVFLLISVVFLISLLIVKKRLGEGSSKITLKTFFNKDLLTFKNLVLVLYIGIFLINFLISKEFSVSGFSAILISLSLILFAYLFSSLISFQSFVEAFRKVFPFICLMSLVVYIPCIFMKDLPVFMAIETSSDYYYNNFFFLCFQLFSSQSRNCSIFWEPGTFAIFLNIAIVFEFINAKRKQNILALIIYVICLITTFSTAGYIEFVFTAIICILFLKDKKKIIVYSSILLFAVALFTILFFTLPIVNNKFFNSAKSGSFASRINGTIICMNTIFKGNFFGVGSLRANEYFIEVISKTEFAGRVDAIVSTFAYYCIAYGFFGFILYLIPIIFLLSCLRIKWWQRVALLPLVLIITNVEPMALNLFYLLFIFYVVEEFTSTYGDKEDLLHVPSFDEEKTIGGYFNKKVLQGNKNNKILIKNSLGSFIVRGLALLLGLFTTAGYLKYFGEKSTLGVWFVILQIIVFILTFDLGIGHGLKNRLIAAFTNGEKEKAEKYIVSAVITSLGISIAAIVLGLFVCRLLDFNTIFNISPDLISNADLRSAMIIIVVSIAVQFFLKIVGSVYEALQIQFATSIFALFTNISLFIFVNVAEVSGGGNKLNTLAIVYLFVANIPYVVGAIILLLTKLKGYKFKVNMFDFESAREVTSLGSKFLLIQICLLIINSSNSLILSNLYSSASVPDYTVYQKLFNVVVVVCSLLTGPIWAIVAKAKTSREEGWIKNLYKRLLFLGIVLISVDALLMVSLQPIFDIIFPDYELKVNWGFALVFAGHSICMVIVGLASSLCNGLEVLKPQIYGSLIGIVIKIGLTIMQFTVPAIRNNVNYWYLIQLASLVSLLPSVVLCSIGVYKTMKKMSLEHKNI